MIEMGEIKNDLGYPSITPLLKKSRGRMVHVQKQLSPIDIAAALLLPSRHRKQTKRVNLAFNFINGNRTTCNVSLKQKSWER